MFFVPLTSILGTTIFLSNPLPAYWTKVFITTQPASASITIPYCSASHRSLLLELVVMHSSPNISSLNWAFISSANKPNA